MAFFKESNAPLIEHSVSPDKWVSKTSSKLGNIVLASDHSLLGQYPPDRFLLSHVTIICSVQVEKDIPYLIVPECNAFVNNNGDSWENDLLLNTYKTFIGGHNYLEHVQIEELSKGKIADAAIRHIYVDEKLGIYHYYVDILVATDKEKDPNVIKRVLDGDLKFMSMGASVAYTFCTRCGNKAEDMTQLCTHIRYTKCNTFIDEQGKKRITAELCFPGYHKVLMSDNSYKYISDVMVGDYVISHLGQPKKVIKTYKRNVYSDLIKLITNKIAITSTTEHPHFVYNGFSQIYDFKSATSLDYKNDFLCEYISDNNYIKHKIDSIAYIPGKGIETYNLEVEDHNSYIVDGIATHNCGSKDDLTSNRFFEASWVSRPAFEGAALRNFVNIANLDLKQSFQIAPFTKLQSNNYNSPLLSQFLKAASDVSNKLNEFKKVSLNPTELNFYEKKLESLLEKINFEGEKPENLLDISKNVKDEINKEEEIKELIKKRDEDISNIQHDEDVPNDLENDELRFYDSLVVGYSEKNSSLPLVDFILNNKTSSITKLASYRKIHTAICILAKGYSIKELKNFGFSNNEIISVNSFILENLNRDFKASTELVVALTKVGNLNLYMNKQDFFSHLEDSLNRKLGSSEKKHAILLAKNL